jgi:succinoglycan biosynthesis protein ExoM
MRLAICIGTYKRSDLLCELLAGISHLTFRRMPAPRIEVIVVDNDPFKSAEEVCAAVELPCPVKYVAEPRRGITYVRNRAVREAGVVDFIVFIDDDEVPTPQWLDELLAAQHQFGADIVSGPVFPKFAHGVAEWVKAGKFFDRPAFANGRSLDRCSTNNALIRSEVFLRVPAFDDRFRLSGGEDTHFFLRARQAGHSIVWSQEAIVHESIPEERARLAWILRRAYQSGNSWSLCEASLDARMRVRLTRLAIAFGHLVKGSAGVLLSLCLGRAAVVNSLRSILLGAGMLTGLVGRRYLAYEFAGTGRVKNTPKPNEQTLT